MNVSKSVEKVVRKVLNHIADSELYEWPPQCAFIYYQPKRPSRIGAQNKANMTTEKTLIHDEGETSYLSCRHN